MKLLLHESPMWEHLTPIIIGFCAFILAIAGVLVVSFGHHVQKWAGMSSGPKLWWQYARWYMVAGLLWIIAVAGALATYWMTRG